MKLVRPTSRSHAFTLIELLTVIAIIGILAAILIPTVGAVRAKAQSSKTVSNWACLEKMDRDSGGGDDGGLV